MTFYYKSQNEELGPIMDELARNILHGMVGKGSGNLDTLTKRLWEKHQGEFKNVSYHSVQSAISEVIGREKTGADVMGDINVLFPLIEDVVARELKYRSAEPESKEKFNEDIGYFAMDIYYFISSLKIPFGLFENIIQLKDFRMQKFEALTDKINYISTDIGLDIQKVYNSLETLTQGIRSFRDITDVIGRYNLFFTTADVIPDFTQNVGILVNFGLSLDESIDLAKKIHTEYTNKEITPLVMKLLGSMPEKDLALVEKELDFAGVLDKRSRHIKGQQTQKLVIEDYGRRIVVYPPSFEYRELEGSDSSYGFGLFLPIIGVISSDYTLNKEKSRIVNEKNQLHRGTTLVFEKDNREIQVSINYKGEVSRGNLLHRVLGTFPISVNASHDTTHEAKVEIKGLSRSEFANYLITFQFPSGYIESLFEGVETLSQIQDLPKTVYTKNSTLRYASSSALYGLSQLNLQDRTAGTILLMVDTKSPSDMFKKFMEIQDESQLDIRYNTTEGLVKVEIDLNNQEKVIERQDFRGLLDILDRYVIPPHFPLCTTFDLLCYLNESAHPEQIPKLLNTNKSTFMKVGTLFYYPDTFKHAFGYLDDKEKKYAVDWLYALRSESQPSEIKNWLNENYHDLIEMRGIDRV